MTSIDAIILGILQGLTEYLPVSSSGHLAVAQYFLGLREPLVAFDVLLHIGSLAAVCLYYRRELLELAVSTVAPRRAPQGRRLILMIILATLPTGLIGFGFKDFVETQFASPAAVGIFWLLTAGLLFGVSRIANGEKSLGDLRISDALLIGLFQGIAVLPGVSRSGATIVMGMLCGLRPKEAANFSFLISIPAILGAIVLQREDLQGLAGPDFAPMMLGTLVSAIVSYLAILVLLKLLQRRIILPFAWYLAAAGFAVMILLMAGVGS
jgi:undecaprenyl-diphosphatase